MTLFIDLSESDFFKLRPPLVGYMIEAKSTVTASTLVRTPESVVSWNNFKDGANSVSWDDSPRYTRPKFVQFSTICGEEDVREALNVNVLRRLNIVLEGNEVFTRHHASSDVVGEPDFIQMGSDRVLHLVIEVKTKWDLSVDDLVVSYAQDLAALQNTTDSSVSVYHHIKHVFGYLVHNCLRYGVLTTYEKTWFLYRPPETPGQLCISPAIRCDSQNPTLFQCLSYLTLLAHRGHECRTAPPLTELQQLPPPQHYGGNISKGVGLKRKAGSENVRRNPRRNATQGKKASPDRDEECMPLKFFDWGSFEVLDVLGAGRTGTVFKAILHGETVALKLCDLWKHPDYEEELCNKIKMYHALKDLQGHCIPRLKGAGYTAGGMFVIATTIAGQPLNDVKSLTDNERLMIRTALSRIHRRGFVHNDIREDNVLIKRNGHESYAFIIDFAFSKRGGRLDFRREMRFLESLPIRSSEYSGGQ